MGTKLLVKALVVCVLSLCLLPAPTPAQEGEQNNQLVWVREVTVKPPLGSDYVAAMAEFVKMLKGHNFPYGFSAWVDGNFHYFYAFPVDSYQAPISIYEAIVELMKKWGEDNALKYDKAMAETISTYKDYFVEYLADYSYVPENPRLKDEEITFGIWDIFHIPLDKEEEYWALIEEYLPLMKEMDISESMLLYTGRLGTERPFYFGLMYGKSPSDFWAANAKMWEKLGEKGNEFYKKFMRLLDKREFKQFWHIKNLSYWPEQK